MHMSSSVTMVLKKSTKPFFLAHFASHLALLLAVSDLQIVCKAMKTATKVEIEIIEAE